MAQRKVLHVSDIYRLILDTEGVVAVKKLQVLNLTNGANPEGEPWVLALSPDAFHPVLDATASAKSMIFTKRDVSYSVDSKQVIQVFQKN